ncbi:hypothetical protein [Candidatus Thiodictyon syntrophicum]|uniref:Uncharacterized protein n=1 Tax=Candidatus Thiodictyon syntrophicum TaxID=1166950 RepID=A0A2K8UEE0_9GAMM|nr:hypothetical protein [Candidatus Thiodictyon syntrophicum]AUB83944.1 hypothetical protein THSYN_25435 [Candidatus Thiodictyon syntrophicum]
MSNDKPLRVSKAPFKPVSGGARSGPDGDQPTRPTAKPPRWAYWQRIKSASPWKLAALSLGIEPASIDADDAATFPAAATFGRFNLITEAIKRRFGADDRHGVSLAEFIAWADSISLQLPPELRAPAAAPDGRPNSCA